MRIDATGSKPDEPYDVGPKTAEWQREPDQRALVVHANRVPASKPAIEHVQELMPFERHQHSVRRLDCDHGREQERLCAADQRETPLPVEP